MSDKKQLPTSLISDLEQFESTLANFALITGSYYKALVDSGIPPELANQLTIQWHELYWTDLLNKGGR